MGASRCWRTGLHAQCFAPLPGDCPGCVTRAGDRWGQEELWARQADPRYLVHQSKNLSVRRGGPSSLATRHFIKLL